MNDEGFKKFIKNRTIEDIMNDYADQRDEWETLVEIKDGYIVRFKHNNGKYFFCMQYEGENGAVILMPEKTAENKTISEQMESLFIKI